MNPKFFKILKISLLAIVAVFFVGFITMLLWNWLMPVLFKLPEITIWQALGLLILSKIFFSSFGGKKGGKCHYARQNHWRKKMEEKMAKMSDEEREKFKQKWGNWGWQGSEMSEI